MLIMCVSAGKSAGEIACSVANYFQWKVAKVCSKSR